MKINCYSIDKKRNRLLKYVIIAANYQPNNWIFVQHRERNTWEIPAGHIEKGETPTEAAKRELFEETGAICYSIFPLCDYSVKQNFKKQYGRLFIAHVEKLGDLPNFEIEKIIISDTMPSNLTYSAIQTFLFDKVIAYKKGHPLFNE